VLGLMAMGLGTIIRHTAGAISAFVAILLVLPIILQALPYSLSTDIRRFMPDQIAVRMVTTQARNVDFRSFSPWVGMFILCGYAVVLLVIGASMLNRRDARARTGPFLSYETLRDSATRAYSRRR
jgi:ABC-2 type transport system permease protein